MRSISILGSTGSVGVSTLDVISRHPDKYQLFALTANTQVDKLYEQCIQYQPHYAVMCDAIAAESLRERLSGYNIEVLHGDTGLIDVASASDVDIVMCAIVGAAGLQSSLAAARSGKQVLLANKESLVMSGDIFMSAIRQTDATLIPIDSEHNAIYQCLPETHASALINGTHTLAELGIEKILLTGSGGPFRDKERATLASISPEEAIAHPNWSMGPKISVDSATMMNKGLEYIEACWLFSASAGQIEILVHPESIIHSMVQYRDGSVLAQMGLPDMRTPIAYGLGYPERISAGVGSVDFTQISALNFEPADTERFPAIKLAQQAMSAGGTAPAILNAANEQAVAAFLDGRLKFLAMTDVIEYVMDTVEQTTARELEAILAADEKARNVADEWIRNIKS